MGLSRYFAVLQSRLLTRRACHNHRFKPEMWAKVAEEMAIPWRAAEAMHWQLGENDMARRAGVVPFTLTAVNQQQDNTTRSSPSRGHAHSHSQGSLPRSDPHLLGRYPHPLGPPTHMGPTSHLPHHHQQQHPPPPPHPLTIPPPIPTIPPPGPGRGGPMPPRRESMPPRPTPEYLYEAAGHHAPGPGLPPLQTGRERGSVGGMQLPSVAELTTGVSPYSTPAYSLGGVSASPSATASPRASALQGLPVNYSPDGSIGGSSKRGRSSPDSGREATRRRH